MTTELNETTTQPTEQPTTQPINEPIDHSTTVYTYADMVQAYINGGLNCVHYEEELMQYPSYEEWLDEYTAEKEIK